MSFQDKFKEKYNLLTVLGPTAGGKTSFAAHLAKFLDAEIISADSRQVYRGMDIGTGKDIADYTVVGELIPYHLIDIVDAGEKYNLFQFQRDFFRVYDEISGRNKLPLMCGGTGLYVDAIVQNYELLEVPENTKLRQELQLKTLEELVFLLSSLKNTHNTSDFDTKKRAIRAIEIEYYKKEHQDLITNYPKIKSLNIGVKFDRESQKRRITERLRERLENGMIEEVEKLHKKGVPFDSLIYYGLEYKFVTLYLQGELSYNELFEKLNVAIHQFSKRQMTWFRRMEKKGVKIWWLDGYASVEDKIKRVGEILEK